MNSFSINFLGKKNKKDANNEFPIYCRMSMNGKRIEIFTKRYIKSKDWDRNRRRAHPRTKKLREFNLYMENFSSRIFQPNNTMRFREEKKTIHLPVDLTGNLTFTNNTMICENWPSFNYTLEIKLIGYY